MCLCIMYVVLARGGLLIKIFFIIYVTGKLFIFLKKKKWKLSWIKLKLNVGILSYFYQFCFNRLNPEINGNNI